jgi:hypothetical protein
MCVGWSEDADSVENTMTNIHGTRFIVLKLAYLGLDITFPNWANTLFQSADAGTITTAGVSESLIQVPECSSACC